VDEVTENDISSTDAHELASSLVGLIQAARHRVTADGESELVKRITDHIGCPLRDMPNVATKFERWEHVNLYLGIRGYLQRHSPDAEWVGISGSSRGFHDLMDMLTQAQQQGSYVIGPPDYITAAVSPDNALDVVQIGLVLTRTADGAPIVIGLRGVIMDHGPDSRCELRIFATDRAIATSAREEIETLIAEQDIYRGQLLYLDVSDHRGNELVSFLPRPDLTAHDVVLPSGVLDKIERHVVHTAERSAQLRRAGQHLKRGLLLYGPPGTGKTHTVRYLLSRMSDLTVVLLSGRSLFRLLSTAVSLARRLQPSVLVLEDIDLVAEDRSMGAGSMPVLFELLNRIDGVDTDADVTFVMTTNRVETIERALAERPGRVDLAVEIPKPDAAGREQLLRLYAEGTDLDLPDASGLVADMAGVTASFVRELVRRAVSARLDEAPDEHPVRLDETVLSSALAELLDQRNQLTRNLIGGAASHPIEA
jgi:hypothetical protein